MERIIPNPVFRTNRNLQTTDTHDRPVWRGDHRFSSEAAAYSLTNFLEPEIQKKHPDWTKDQVRDSALKQFETRLRQDLSYEHKEVSHEESLVVWQPIQTEKGWELATPYGDSMITLSQLWDHTREYAEFVGNPSAYHADEHRAQISMQDAFLKGEATGFVSVLSHPDSVRYVQLWQKTDDGSVVSTQIDLYKTTGRDFSHDEGATLVRHLQHVHDGGAHEKTLSTDDIRMVAIAQTMQREEVYIPHFSGDVGTRVLRDSTDSMMTFGAYLRDHIEKKLQEFRDGSSPKTKRLEAHIHRNERTTRQKRKKAEAVRTQNPVPSMLAEWWVTQKIVQHKEFIPVAAVAALTWITMSPSKSMPKLKVAVMRKNLVSFEKKVVKKNDAPIEKKRFRARPPQRDVHQTMTVFERPDRGKLKTTKARVQQEYKRLFQRVMVTIKKLAVRLSKPEERQRQEGKPDVVHMERSKKVRASERFVFAILMWWIIRAPLTAEHKRTAIQMTQRGEMPGEHSPVQWIIVSIIWYLVMLRESGKAGSRSAGKKKARQLLWHQITLDFVIE